MQPPPSRRLSLNHEISNEKHEQILADYNVIIECEIKLRSNRFGARSDAIFDEKQRENTTEFDGMPKTTGRLIGASNPAVGARRTELTGKNALPIQCILATFGRFRRNARFPRSVSKHLRFNTGTFTTRKQGNLAESNFTDISTEIFNAIYRTAVAILVVSKDRPTFYRCNSKTTSFRHRKNFLKYGNHIFKLSKLKARRALKGRKMCGFSTRVKTRRNL